MHKLFSKGIGVLKISPRLLLRWVVVQAASIFCLVTAAMMLMVTLTRSGEVGFFTGPFGPAYVLMGVLLYGLHWQLQDKAFSIDPLRSDRITSVIRMRPSRQDPDW